MISRRNIRIKALHSIYSIMHTSEDGYSKDARVVFDNFVSQAIQLLLGHVLVAKQLCEYCIVESTSRKAKKLPTEEDLNWSTTPSTNEIVQALHNNASFKTALSNYKMQGRWSELDEIKKFYVAFAQADFYKKYVELPLDKKEADADFFAHVLDYVVGNEDIQQLFDDLFLSYEEDKQSIADWIKENGNKIATTDYNKLLPLEKRNFGLELVDTVLDKKDLTFEMIKPKLINWEAERVATMDMILLQMGLTEMLYFPTIPAKVTINEYIDLAKQYSTLQSGNFVNGILDKLFKALTNENKIHKIEKAPKA